MEKGLRQGVKNASFGSMEKGDGTDELTKVGRQVL